MIATLLVGVAAALLLWPSQTKQASIPMPSAATPATKSTPSYQQAILALVTVRQRLLDTDCLDDAGKKAVDQIVISLVAGSDK